MGDKERDAQAVAELPHPHALPREAGRRPPRCRPASPVLGLLQEQRVGRRRRKAWEILVDVGRRLERWPKPRQGRGFCRRRDCEKALGRGKGLGWVARGTGSREWDEGMVSLR
jgi:hypothetical protein